MTSLIKKYHNMLLKKQLSAKELTKFYLNNIKKYDNILNSYITVTQELAISLADNVDKKLSKGEDINILEGIPYSIKDNISTKDITTTCASKMLEDYVPFYNAYVYDKLLNSSSVLLGKTNMDEFAMGSSGETSFFGPTLNPYNPDFVPGGSSSGSAVSVCSNLSMFSIGSDTGGSIRLPSSYTNLVGFKPSYGYVSRYGLISYASSFDTVSIVANSVEDVSIVFDAISSYDKKDQSMHNVLKDKSYKNINSDIRDLKIGILTEFLDGCDDEIKKGVVTSINNFKSLGANIKEFNTSVLNSVINAYYIISMCEASSNLSRYDSLRYGINIDDYTDFSDLLKKSRSLGFGGEVKKRIMMGNFALSTLYKDEYYLKALKMRESIKNIIGKILDETDIIIIPTSKMRAKRLGEFKKNKISSYFDDACSSLANVSSLCALNLPCAMDKNNVPFGFTLMAKNGNDNLLLNVANIYEKNFITSLDKPLIYGGEL